MENTVIEARFTNIKNVVGRGVCQIVCEVPLDLAHGALNTLGYPSMEGGIRVAIARLNDERSEG